MNVALFVNGNIGKFLLSPHRWSHLDARDERTSWLGVGQADVTSQGRIKISDLDLAGRLIDRYG
jgi:hypothetical protein